MNTKKIMTIVDEIAYNNYKLTADKILQLLSQIRKNSSASAKRWVWELLKNAKDVKYIILRLVNFICPNKNYSNIFSSKYPQENAQCE